MRCVVAALCGVLTGAVPFARAAAQMDMSGMSQPATLPLGIPESRLGSGTSWLPDAAPMHAIHVPLGGWTAMAHGVASLLAPLLVWLVVGPDRLLLVYPVWHLLAGMAFFACADMLGLHHLEGGAAFAASVLGALAPAWAPLILATFSSLNMALLGLLFRRVRRPGTQEEDQRPGV